MFRRVLIANRGEVAARVLRTCRRLGIEVVAVASEADADAAWLADADVVVPIGPARAARSYLDQDALLETALHHRCAAVHPGWGFLAENDQFAARCEAAGLTFVGPRPRQIRMMGDKALARRTMADLGLDVIPGTREPVSDAAEASRAAEEIGFPLLLKAVAGGGGKGMRAVETAAELPAAFAQASGEAASAFGDGRIYLERRVEGGRHIEVQIVADRHGTCVALGERECSLQRRHQKVLEEAPAPGLPAGERARVLPQVAEVVSRAGYLGAGTVEMLLDRDGRLWFMEMNTRLQVEHPVTELVTGVDIAQEQIRIAANLPLGLRQEDVRFRGHALECRINAEDPADGFRPSPGRLAAFELGGGAGPGTVRVDTHLRTGDEVSPYYDSLLAKVIAHAPTREEAIETMLSALSAARVEGVQTTIPLHLAVLKSRAFRSGEYDTSGLPGWS